MADKKSGYIKLYRSIQDNWIWNNNEPYDIRSAWTDLLLSVNHKEKKIKLGSRIQVIKPGQMWTSYKKLGRKWNWSYKRVLRYITLLKSDGMIYVDGTPNGTLLTVINWDNFNGQGITYDTPHDTPCDTPLDTPDATPGDTQTRMNKNVKNDKERKEKDPAPLEIEPPTGGGQWQ